MNQCSEMLFDFIYGKQKQFLNPGLAKPSTTKP